jgi:starch phosphorylase
LYNVLERDIVPRFYDRSEGPVPRRWIERMKRSIATLGGFVGAERMVREYAEHLYEPAAAQGQSMTSAGFERARELARWKARVRAAWHEVDVVDVQGDVTAVSVGTRRDVLATVRTGTLETGDVCVQLAHGRVGPSGMLVDPESVDMELDGCIDGTCSYRGVLTARSAGLYGFAVRVLPVHRDLSNRLDMGLTTWG